MKFKFLKLLVTYICMMVIFCLELDPRTVMAMEDTEKNVDEPDNLYALSACLMDAESGRILFEKEGDVKRANASTTKVLTLIVTLENSDLDETVTVSDYAQSQPDVQMHMQAGESYILRDLCYGMMLESYNDAAVAIAEHVAGSVESFSCKMNEKAQEIGCKNSYFITPNGLDAEDTNGFHGTTAEDLARILSYAIEKSPKKDLFLKITGTSDYNFTDVAGKRSFQSRNHNAFLHMMEGALSGKTGFTGDAGYCYVGALKQGDRVFTVALLGCGWPNNKSYKWSDMRKLMQYALDQYNYEDVCEKAERLSPVKIIGAADENYDKIEDQEMIPEAEEVNLHILKAPWETIESYSEYPKEMEAPVKEGTKIGTVSYYLEGECIAEVPIKVTRTIERRNLKWFWIYILKKYML